MRFVLPLAVQIGESKVDEQWVLPDLNMHLRCALGDIGCEQVERDEIAEGPATTRVS